ncbi:prepilin peptidase [Lihuaxuella thermophila]|uniref:Type IV leader peptidase family protein n=1 Tax=Lihuaxuella thermophila TaxID=1173111 RepID=A0A1H8FQW3_9BACL|nr:A24 family peptidase [Lihuaxuella thermophila]SEN34191.1 Type IV leader peptidase family protein [Lihuaxuella thermophila]
MDSWLFWLIGVVGILIARWLPVIAWLSLAGRPDKPELAGWPCSTCKGEREDHWHFFQWNSCCRDKASGLQTGVQAVAGLSIWLFTAERGVNVEAWIHLLLFWFLIIVTLTDYWSGLIPNLFTYSGMVLFFLLRMVFHPQPFIHYLLASLSAFAGLFILGRVTGGLGGGDAKLLAMAAWVIGWPHVATAFWLAIASACLYIGWKALRRQPLRAGQPFPFGPHLALGVYVASLWGDCLLDWYLSWFFSI